MKMTKFNVGLVALLGTLALGGCSSSQMAGESGKDIASTGPTVLNERVSPSTIELTQGLQPLQTPEIAADVKDYTAGIADVKLRFIHAPLEIPMENIAGTTWRATLTTKILRSLAVSGKTITYEANIVARNKNGTTATGSKPINITIKTPDIATSG